MNRDDWNRRYAERQLLWSEGPNRLLAAEAATLASGRALDVACGEGRNAIWLAERGWKVTAVDFAEVALELVLAELVDWRPPRLAYDLVVVLYVQLPRAERQLVLGRAAAAVAPGGTALLLGHDSRNLDEGHGGPSDPAVLWTAAAVASELRGLEVERAETVLREVEGADRPALDTLVRARRL